MRLVDPDRPPSSVVEAWASRSLSERDLTPEEQDQAVELVTTMELHVEQEEKS